MRKNTTCFLGLVLSFCVMACTAQNTDSEAKVDLTVEEFKSKMQDPDVIVIDVRTPKETANGTVPNAVEINFQSPDFASQVEQLDKDKTYMVYCAAGARSKRATALMKEKGFPKVYNLLGGYKDIKSE